MDYQEFIEIIKKYKQNIVLAGLLGGLLGGISFFVLPPRYNAVGSLFVTRSVESIGSADDGNVFLYEGFYASQNSQAYTTSLIGILQSRDLHSLVLKDLNLEITNKNLSTIKRSIRVSKQAPQVIRLQTKGNTPVSAEGLWNSLTGHLEDFNEKVGREGDPNLSIIRVAENPIISESYRNIYLNFAIGAGIGVLFLTFWYVLKHILSIKK